MLLIHRQLPGNFDYLIMYYYDDNMKLRAWYSDTGEDLRSGYASIKEAEIAFYADQIIYKDY